MKNLFYAKISDEAPPRLIIHYKKEFKVYLEKNKGKEVELFIEKVSGRHSDAQRRMWFGLLVQEIAMTTGYTKEEVHDFLLRKFFGTKDVIIGGEKMTIRRSLTTLDKNELGELVNQATQWAAETLNISIQLPEYDPAPLRHVS